MARKITASEIAERERKKRELAGIPEVVHDPDMSPLRAKKKHILLRELSYRRMQALKIYEPLPVQKKFHECHSPERIIIGGNRGAKTMCCAAEVAMAVMGTHPYIDYPEQGRIICVAKDGIKIGEVFFAKLFMPGAFQMVRDPVTGLWRSWRPWIDGWHIKRKKSLPLIPKRNVVSIAWEDKKLNQPKKIVVRNGEREWEILFFTSAGKPIEGVDVDLVWFDEEIYDGRAVGSWYDEMAARLIDRDGRFIWSATPQAATPQLWKLHEAALEGRNKPNPLVSEFHVTMDDNPFLPDKAKEEFRQKAMRDPDEYRVRVLGEFLLTSHFVYPTFARSKHCIPRFEIPAHWCRYLVVDPGFANVVGLFFAVPPKKESEHVYVYDELYGHQWDARTFCQRIHSKIAGYSFQAFLIDRHGSQRTEASGKNIREQYADEMRRLGLRSLETGSDFLPIGETGHQNSSPVRDGCNQVRSWLRDCEECDDRPKLLFFDDCTNVIEEMSKYRMKVVKGKATDQPDGERHSHGPDCVRYARVHGIPYVEPRLLPKMKSGLQRYLQKIIRQQNSERKNFVNLGPSFRS